MDRKSGKLVKRIEKAGIKTSLKEGHALDEQELLNLKIQVLPAPLRIFFLVVGMVAGAGSWFYFAHAIPDWGTILAIVAVLSMLFGIFGVRKTLSRILDSMDALDSLEILKNAGEGIADAIGSVMDGL